MHQAPGADLSKRLIGKELMDFYVEASAVHGYCSPDVPTFAEQRATADEQYFEKICSNSNHMLNYNLRPRVHTVYSYRNIVPV